MKIKESIKVTRKNNIYYILDSNGKIVKYKPWLGDIFSCLYDRIMEKSIFPKKFKGDFLKHFNILREEYQNIHGINLLEIATGSGFSSDLISNDNSYTGIDISSGLLSLAVRKFNNRNFREAEFYISDASDLPFNDSIFDVVICDLSLNFLGDIQTFIKEMKRVMKKESVFYCSVPVPEKKHPKVTIHGNLYSENELEGYFTKYDFIFSPARVENGALLYFSARLHSSN